MILMSILSNLQTNTGNLSIIFFFRSSSNNWRFLLKEISQFYNRSHLNYSLIISYGFKITTFSNIFKSYFLIFTFIYTYNFLWICLFKWILNSLHLGKIKFIRSLVQWKYRDLEVIKYSKEILESINVIWIKQPKYVLSDEYINKI